MVVNHLTDFVVRYKMQLIAGVAMVALAAYVIPFDSLLGLASAAKGGNDDNNSGKNDNPNRFKVCEHNSQPQKCYGRSG
jgi:hypothetical protein